MVDTYLNKALLFESLPRNMKIRIVTPKNYLIKFPFANEIIQDEISKRGMIGTIFTFIFFRSELWCRASKSRY